jgi:hypothetical protein
MTASTDRHMFRETVALVAEKAKAKLPQAVNGRIEKVVKLVLMGDVFPQADGTILVGSSSEAMTSYLLVGQACECQDFTRGNAPEGWCAHRIAAGIAKRVGEMVPPSPAGETEIVEPEPDNDPEPEVPAPTSAPVSLPEAAFSLTLKGTLDGVEALLTARGQTAQEFTRNLEAIRGLLDAPTPAQGQQPDGWCAVHQTALKLNHGRDGRTWLSHRTAEGWCKGR